jgi:very-short-patch-repair endonuclease
LKKKTAFAKSLRKQMTDSEQRLWFLLRAHRFAGMKFKRQHPIGPYIVDFVSVRQKIVVEVDGGQHLENQLDVKRDAWLREHGFRVLRFWNSDVLKETEAVLQVILEAIEHVERPLP